MANELTLGVSLAYSDANGAADEIVASGIVDSVSNPVSNRSQPLVSHTADTAIPLGGVSGPIYLVVRNLDATNFVTIKDASAGVAIAKVRAGKVGLIPLPPQATAPYARADTGDVRIDVLVC